MGRDFSGQNLRGRNFRGQDLRGASFVNADIRGANFTDAELQGADFTGAIAGLQKRWAIGKSVLGFVLSLVVNLVATILNATIIDYYFRESMIGDISIVPGMFVILLILGTLLALAKEGFTIYTFSIIIILLIAASAFTVAIRVGVVFISTQALAGQMAAIFMPTVAVAVAVAGAVVFTFAVTFAVAFAVAFTDRVEFSIAGAVVGVFVFVFAFTVGFEPGFLTN